MRAACRLCLLAAAAVACVLAIACKKDANADAAAASRKAPSAAELNAFVTGAGRVRLGMTEDEVSDALGKRATRRQNAMSPGAPAEVAWDDIQGENPGFAHGRFLNGKLVLIEYATAKTAMPRVSADAARSLEAPDIVRRSVARTLRMEDVEAVTGSRGLRARWSLADVPGGNPIVMSTWVWEVEPGGRVLIVEEEKGLAGQPVIRSLKRRVI